MIGLLVILLFTSSLRAAPELPPRAQALNGKFAVLHGPNCWNSALYSVGVVSGVRHVDYAEFTSWLESPFCQEVEEKSAAAGDIVALRRARSDGRLVTMPYSAEVHGYLLAAPGLAFTKNGTSKGDGYQLQDTASLHANYETVNRRECRILGVPREFCGMKAQYFRCSPVLSLGLPGSLKAIEEDLVKLEGELHRLYMGELPLDSLDADKARIKLKVDSLSSKLDAAAADDDTWQIELLRRRLVSARTVLF